MANDDPWDNICDNCGEPLDDDGECPVCRGPAEPEEGDYVTTDHRKFWQDGKLVVEVGDGEDWMPAVAAHMEREQFWPGVWFESDHGNFHLMIMRDE